MFSFPFPSPSTKSYAPLSFLLSLCFFPFIFFFPLGKNSAPSQYHGSPLHVFSIIVSLAWEWCKIINHFLRKYTGSQAQPSAQGHYH